MNVVTKEPTTLILNEQEAGTFRFLLATASTSSLWSAEERRLFTEWYNALKGR